MQDCPQIKLKPQEIFAEYEMGNNYKSSVGTHGIFEQAKINERFFVGDHWYGAQCGNDRPLVRQNVIKRIGEYKISTIGSAPIAINYSAEGYEVSKDVTDEANTLRQSMVSGEWSGVNKPVSTPEISVITDAMSRYQKTCAERLRFGLKAEQLLRNAYISGTGIAYTYWDNEIDTGLFADDRKTTPIKGDIAFEILDVENVVFGDPNNDDVQSQPYIIISQRLDVEDVRREAKRNGLPVDDIIPDGAYTYNSGERGEQEPTESRRITVITKFYKEWNKDGLKYKVMAIKTTEKAVVRKAWDVNLTMYPIAKFCWERRRSCAYGDSEITYLIPNQIAINRMLTAECWSAIALGMPKLIVNSDVMGDIKVTNDPGQVIKVYPGASDRLDDVLRYIAPPAFASQYQNAINDLTNNTLSNSGANDAALGNVRPDNAAAIIQSREAALQPMQIHQNRYYATMEEIARIWADFWLSKYGNRPLKVVDRNGVRYIPFDADRYRNLVITAKVDVGASTLWSEATTISTLDALYTNQIIDAIQYLERLPKGIIPNLTELIEDLRKKVEQQTQMQTSQNDVVSGFAKQYPEQYKAFASQSPEEQKLMIEQIMGGAAE